MALKSRLTPEVKSELLKSEGLMGMLADKVRTTQYTIKRQVLAESPTLCLPHYLSAIKELLGLNDDAVICETYESTQPELITD
jgi:hypothetical protein